MTVEETKTGEEQPEEATTEEVEETEEATEEEKPFWLQEEEPDSSEEEEGSEKSDAVPVAAHVKTKKKLKAKLSEKDDELTKLREELQQLKQDGQQSTSEPPKRPRRSEFDDDDAYDDAMDKYEEDKRNYDAQFLTQSTQQRQQAQQQQQRIQQSVNRHYEKAEELVEKHGIKPEIYQQADAAVKGAIQSALPNYNAENVFDGMVDMIGEGSEIAMFHIGRNKQANAEFTRALQEDPTGLKASIYLGRIAERVSNTKPKRDSQAPAPATKIKGDEASSAKGSAAYKKYKDAQGKGKAQEAYNIKKEARKQGIDVSGWVK